MTSPSSNSSLLRSPGADLSRSPSGVNSSDKAGLYSWAANDEYNPPHWKSKLSANARTPVKIITTSPNDDSVKHNEPSDKTQAPHPEDDLDIAALSRLLGNDSDVNIAVQSDWQESDAETAASRPVSAATKSNNAVNNTADALSSRLQHFPSASVPSLTQGPTPAESHAVSSLTASSVYSADSEQPAQPSSLAPPAATLSSFAAAPAVTVFSPAASQSSAVGGLHKSTSLSPAEASPSPSRHPQRVHQADPTLDVSLMSMAAAAGSTSSAGTRDPGLPANSSVRPSSAAAGLDSPQSRIPRVQMAAINTAKSGNERVTKEDERHGVFTADKSETETMIAGYQRENQRLIDELRELKAASKAVEQHLTVENQQLSQTVAKQKDQLENLRVQLQQTVAQERKKREGLEAEISRLMKENAAQASKHAQEIAMWEQQVSVGNTLHANATDLEKANSALRQQLADVRREHAHEIKQRQEDLERLQTRNAYLTAGRTAAANAKQPENASVEELLQIVRQQSEAIAGLHRDLEEQTNAFQRVQAQSDAAKADHVTSIASLTVQLQAATERLAAMAGEPTQAAKIATLQIDLQRLQTENTLLREELNQAAAGDAVLEGGASGQPEDLLRSQIRRLQSDLQRRDQQLATMTRRAEELQSVNEARAQQAAINQDLKDQLQRALDLNLRYEEAQKRSDDSIKRAQAEAEERLRKMEEVHAQRLEKMSLDRAIAQSNDEVAQWKHKAEAFEVVVGRLKEELRTAPSRDYIDGLNKKVAVQAKEVETLRRELSRAREFHTPSMQHFETIEWKIRDLETQLQRREGEVQQLRREENMIHRMEVEALNNKWEQILLDKNSELDRYRSELDSILDVLANLRKQGIRVSANVLHARSN
eukprot:m.68460 g.68460  ORF g.68460 m.68460 type:complete len:881 (-) comp14181_c0_seq1:497-3139(-)